MEVLREGIENRTARVAMGHRDDVWKSPVFQDLLLGALSWVSGNVEADITPNLDKAAPQANELPAGKKKD